MKIISLVNEMLRRNARKRPFGLLGALALSLDFFSSRKGFSFQSAGKFNEVAFIGEAVTALDKVGFYAVDGFFNHDEVKILANSLRAAIRSHPELIHPATPYDKRLHGIENLDPAFKIYSQHALLHEIARIYHRQAVDVAFTLGAILEAATNNPGSGGGWHRDSSVRQFKTMVYLSDVGINEGPFQIVEKSHRFLKCVQYNRIMDLRYGDVRINHSDVMRLLDEIGHDKLHTLTAKAGTLLIFDSSAIHRGCPLKNGERLALTNYFFPVSNINFELFQHFKPVAGHST